MDSKDVYPAAILHWNYRGFTEFPLQQLRGEESDITDIYLKENLISRIPNEICRLERLESLYLSGNDITELPKEISRLRCLKCLDVSGNRLRSVPEEVGEVRSLKFLILDDNELTELPLRLGELRALRYLSVCDNKLRWLPQRPVFNYHHCEIRFWRNTDLKTIPYSLWYHMLRDQQTRSLNIGCLSIPQYQRLLKYGRCRLKLQYGSRHWEVDVHCPQQHANIQERNPNNPPSLYELSKRTFYQIISKAANTLSTDNISIYNDKVNPGYESSAADINSEINNNLIDNCNIVNVYNTDATSVISSRADVTEIDTDRYKEKKEHKSYYVPADILDKYFDFLPRFLKEELTSGPVSKCENVKCRKPTFDFVTYEFCLGKIVLIDDTDDVILSAAFCSPACADVWKGGKTNIILPWRLTPT